MKICTFGLARKHLISNVRKGDKIVCCAGKGDWKVVGLGEVTEDYFVDDAKIFLKAGHFVDRFRFQSEKLRTEMDLMSIIDRLSFVTNLAYWAVYFRNGIAKMAKNDWDMIVETCASSDECVRK
ncbi:MAG: hypothetical protein K2W95_20590 [Candidatus Obscuribacterales bacterium]|nr:hypothetical protein [Candidatus Obscuribacterales bacterium]